MPVYEQVKQALQDILAPELQALKAEIKRLDERVESLRNELLAEIRGVDERLKSTKTELLTEIRRVEGRVDALDEKFTGRLNALEEKFTERLNALDEKFTGRLDALNEKFEGLKHEVRTVLEIRERLAAVEARVGITRP